MDFKGLETRSLDEASSAVVLKFFSCLEIPRECRKVFEVLCHCH